jgi:excinuclease ABC subunit A
MTGVSGSGKSTLVLDILARVLCPRISIAPRKNRQAHKSIEGIDYHRQGHLRSTSRRSVAPRARTPATYTGVFTAIRDLFTEMPEAKMKWIRCWKILVQREGRRTLRNLRR